MPEYIKSICRSCFHSYVCEQFNRHRDSHNEKCHFYNDHFVPAADVVSRAAFNQVMWERDVAMEQLKEHSIPFGGKADVEPVKHGRWLQPKSGECFCSECKTLGSPQWKRCPVCEAKMDGGDAG